MLPRRSSYQKDSEIISVADLQLFRMCSIGDKSVLAKTTFATVMTPSTYL